TPLASRQTLCDLLQHPAVAIGVVEGSKRLIRPSLRIGAWHAINRAVVMGEATSAVEYLADVHTAGQKIGTCRGDILHDEVQAQGRTERGILDAGAKADRGERSGWRKLHHPKFVTDDEIAIQAPTQALVEALGPI